MTEENVKLFGVLCEDLNINELVKVLILVVGYIDKRADRQGNN